jgi:hypothetical protein
MPVVETESTDRCFRCDYDLRGIADEQPCPECGLLAERSRRKTEHLADAPPGWLRRVSIGLRLILWACLLTLLWSALLFVTNALLGGSPMRELASLTTLDAETIIVAGYGMCGVLVFIGILLFTAAEPFVANDRWIKFRRRWLRRLAPAPALILAIIWAYSHFHNHVPRVLRYDGDQLSQAIAELAPSFSFVLAANVMLFVFVLGRVRRGNHSMKLRLLGLAFFGTVGALFLLKCVALEFVTRQIYVEVPDYYPNLDALGLLRGFLNVIAVICSRPEWLFAFLMIVFISPLPILLFYHIRALARRTLRLSLAEHCAIVGIGTTATFWSIPAFVSLTWAIEAWMGEGRSRNSQIIVWLLVIELCAWILFGGWSLLTLARGTHAFRKAAIQRKRDWALADALMGVKNP